MSRAILSRTGRKVTSARDAVPRDEQFMHARREMAFDVASARDAVPRDEDNSGNVRQRRPYRPYSHLCSIIYAGGP